MVKDKLFQKSMGSITLHGTFDDAIRLVMDAELKKLDYRIMADFFRNTMDLFAAGEFWGKIMRAATLTYKYTQDQQLRSVIDAAVEDMLSIQTQDGCISTSPLDKQPNGTHGSDLWERKYILLGLLGYYDISGSQRVLEAMCKLLDYTIAQVGTPPKMPITQTGYAFEGIESSSILEPVVKLYHLTKKSEYLEFASYIVGSGACSRENIFEAIYNGKEPRFIGGNGIPQESIAKAYEMMSCFEGLIEYYRATGKEKHIVTAFKFYDMLIDKEITLLGSGGSDKPYNLGKGIGEQWNYTRIEQTNPDIDLMMETCVTVTWLKLCYQLLRLTGEAKYADQIEISVYNALLGSMRPDGCYFDYFQRFNGTRGSKVHFTYKIGDFDLSCCTANGPMGLAYIPFTAVMDSSMGPVVNFYTDAEFTYEGAAFSMVSKYPALGQATLNVKMCEASCFTLFLRIPEWAEDFAVSVGGVKADLDMSIMPGYAGISRKWQDKDCVEVHFKMKSRKFDSPRAEDKQVALMYGPILLARDVRCGEDVNARVEIPDDFELIPVDKTIGDLLQFRLKDMILIDYKSAGATWDANSEFRCWMNT